jgi:hypothetical protein
MKGSRWLILATSLVLVSALRMHSFEEPLEADESIYMLIAQNWAEGGRPYIDYWDNKPIGTFLLFRAGIALFGYAEMTPRIMSILATILTTLMLGCWLWRMSGAVMATCLVVIWPVLSVFVACHANGANMEIFLLPLIVGVCCCLRRYRASHEAKWWWLATAVLALSPLLKQVMAPFLLLPLVVLHCPCELRKTMPRLIGMGAIGLLGHLLVYGLCGYSPAAFFELLGSAASYASDRVQPLPIRVGSTIATGPFHADLRPLLPLVLAAYVGPFLAWRRGRGLLEIAALLACLVAIGIPGGEHIHYYILMLPLMVMSAATCLERLPRRAVWTVGALLGIYLGGLVHKTFLDRLPQEISQDKYGWAWFPRDRFIGQQLKQNGSTGGRVFVDGSHPGVAFYSANSPAPRVFVAWGHKLSGQSPADVLSDLQAAPPDLCLWMNPNELAPGFANWLSANYEELAPIAGARVFRVRSAPAQ